MPIFNIPEKTPEQMKERIGELQAQLRTSDKTLVSQQEEIDEKSAMIKDYQRQNNAISEQYQAQIVKLETEKASLVKEHEKQANHLRQKNEELQEQVKNLQERLTLQDVAVKHRDDLITDEKHECMKLLADKQRLLYGMIHAADYLVDLKNESKESQSDEEDSDE